MLGFAFRKVNVQVVAASVVRSYCSCLELFLLGFSTLRIVSEKPVKTDAVGYVVRTQEVGGIYALACQYQSV